MARVYVSSTTVDLMSERRAVMDWLVAAGHQPVHSYRPSSDTVRDGCLDDVDGCELYVLILGHRYGFQPEDGNPEGLSITHLEFRRARQSGIPPIALLRTSIRIGLSGGEDPEKAALVSAFRAEVTREVRAAEFSDLLGLTQQLSTGVAAELAKLPPKERLLRLAPRPELLAGREDLLADLDARLASGDRPGPRVVVLHGLPGAGKTSAALAYAHDHLGEAGVAWQFAAEDPAVLAAGFGQLAVALGAGEGTGDPVVAVHGVLAARRAGWLLVFDNAPDRASVERFLPPAGDGRVLITSRNALWPTGQAVEVLALGTEVAAGFLVARTGDVNHQAAVALAEAVGGLPLALEQAGAYVQATGGSLAAYLALFQDRRANLLARGQPTGYPRSVAATLALASTQVEESSPGAVELLRLLAFCAPEAVPLRLLLQPRPGLAEQLSPEVRPVLAPLLDDELAVGDAVAALRRFSLVRPAGEGAVSMHRLVQAVTADQMPESLAQAWRQAAAAVVEAAIPGDPQLPSTWPVYAALLPHAQAALTADRSSMTWIGAYLGYSGSYAAARDLYKRLVRAQVQSLGPEHPDTLTGYAHIAVWTGKAGDAAGARDQYAVLLPVYERVLGPEHPDTLGIRRDLARSAARTGDAAGARDKFAALLPLFERVLGPEHPATLTDWANLAVTTGQAGDAVGARDQFAALLPVYERVLGPEDPQTLAARGNLANWTGDTGDAAGARDQYAVLLPIRERLLGPEHPETLITRANLAYWTGEAGDAAAARDLYAALLPVDERVMGPEHPETLTARDNLARWTERAHRRGRLHRRRGRP
jgi:hypothetical protein